MERIPEVLIENSFPIITRIILLLSQSSLGVNSQLESHEPCGVQSRSCGAYQVHMLHD